MRERWWWLRRVVCTFRGHRYPLGEEWCSRRCGAARHVMGVYSWPNPDGSVSSRYTYDNGDVEHGTVPARPGWKRPDPQPLGPEWKSVGFTRDDGIVTGEVYIAPAGTPPPGLLPPLHGGYKPRPGPVPRVYPPRPPSGSGGGS